MSHLAMLWCYICHVICSRRKVSPLLKVLSIINNLTSCLYTIKRGLFLLRITIKFKITYTITSLVICMIKNSRKLKSPLDHGKRNEMNVLRSSVFFDERDYASTGICLLSFFFHIEAFRVHCVILKVLDKKNNILRLFALMMRQNL